MRLVFVIGLTAAFLCFAQGNAASVFERGVQQLSRGDLDGAEKSFRDVLATQPNHIGALGNLGVVYSRQDRPADAVAVYSRALKLAPKEPGLLLNLGLAHLKLDQYTAARPLFERIAAMGKPSPQVRELLATARLFSGDVAAAMPEIEALHRENPASSGVLYLLAVGSLKQKNRDGAAQAFDQLMRTLEPGAANYLAGKAYFESGFFEDAEKSLKAADPRTPGVLLELGKTYVSLRKEDDAVETLRAALRQSPQDTEAAYYLGALLSETPEGVALLEQVRKKRPDSWGALYYLGKALVKQDKAASAIPLLERASKLNPQESAVWFQLTTAYRRAGRLADAGAAAAKVRTLKQEANAPLVLK